MLHREFDFYTIEVSYLRYSGISGLYLIRMNITVVFVAPFLQLNRDSRSTFSPPLAENKYPHSLFIFLQLGNNKHILCKNKSHSMGNYLEIIFIYRIFWFDTFFEVCLINIISQPHSVILLASTFHPNTDFFSLQKEKTMKSLPSNTISWPRIPC